MKIRINIGYILDIFLCFIICSYAGPFASYTGINLFIFISLIVYVLLMGTNRRLVSKKQLGLSWGLLLCYMVLNSMLNLPKSILYLMLFMFCILILKRKMLKNDIALIKNVLRIVTTILAISIIAQAYSPELFYKFAKIWFFYSDQYDMVLRMGNISHQFSGIMYEVSFSAVLLGIGISIFFSDLMTKSGNRILNIVLIIVSYFAIFLTGKRSYILIIPIVLGFCWYLYSIERINTKGLLMLSLAFIVLIYASGDILSWIVKILGRGHEGIQLTTRERYWSIGFEMFRLNPLVGQGLNSFDVWFNQSGIKSHYYSFAGAHNSYIQVLAEMGLIGFALYFFSIGSAILDGVKKLKRSASIKDEQSANNLLFAIVALFCLLVYGLSGNILYQPQQLVTFFFLISVIQAQLCEV